MKTLKLLLALFSFSVFAQNDCSDSLEDLIGNNSINKEVLSEYLNLQAGITLHKLAYATFRSSARSEEFRLEKEILRLLEEREKKGEGSSEFKKAIELFKDPNNSVSRSALAKAMPYVQEILNDQRREKNEFERQMFNLGPADIKMMAMLAERESFVEGRYGSKFYKNRGSDHSILNFTKIINSSIRNFDVIDPERMINRISSLQKRASELLNKLDMSQECKKLVGNCVIKKDEAVGLSSDFASSLMAITQTIEFPDKYERLRYNDVWLYAGKKGAKSAPIREKSGAPIQKESDKASVSIEEDLSIDPDVVLANYFADRVLEVAPALFSREELIASPEFTRSLVKALDEGLLNKKGSDRVFSYNGNLYNFPELWNWNDRDKSGGKLNWAWGKAMEAKDKLEDWWPVANTRRFFRRIGLEAMEVVGLDVEEKFPHIQNEDLPDFLSTWNRQKSGYGQAYTFVFNNQLYDIKTGKEVEKGIGPLLKNFSTGKKADAGTNVLSSKQARSIAAKEAQKGNKSFTQNGVAYHLSGAKVDFDQAYKKAKREHQELGIRETSFPSVETIKKLKDGPLALKTLADGKRAYIKDGKAYDLFKGASLTSFEASSEVARNRSLQGVNRSPADYRGMGQDYLAANAAAVLNHEPTFELSGKIFHTNTGRAVSSGLANSAIAGLKNRDLEIAKYEALSMNKKALISAYEKDHGACEVFGLLDKSSAMLKVLDRKNSRTTFSAEVLLGKSLGDEKTTFVGGLEGPVSNNMTSAGVFTLGKLEKERGFANNGPEAGLAFGRVGLERDNLLYDGDLENNRATDGTVLMQKQDYEDFKKALPDGCAIYSLPQSDNVNFIVRDDQMLLVAVNGEKKMYHSMEPSPSAPKEIKLKLNEEVELNDQTKSFLKSLESNKSRIMSDLGISNDEYNELSKIAFGIMGVESQFGEGLKVFPERFTLKDFFNPRRHKEETYGGALVFLGKLLSRGELSIDPDTRSRGLTQIKAVEEFPHIKEFGGITRDNLMEPEKAAVATMYVLGEMYAQLEKAKAYHSGIHENNKMEYLYYIYNGQIHQVKDSNATPTINARARKAMEYAELLDVYTR